MKGLIQITCGDGKGKTTSAIGQAIRSAGCGLEVIFSRFLKTEKSGELAVLEKIPGIQLIPCKKSFGFYNTMTEEEKLEAFEVYQELFDTAVAKAVEASKGHDALLVMDEIIATYNHGLIRKEDLIRFLENKPENLEVVMTGRNPAKELVDLADYVSEIKKEKHPFDKGIYARKGIEY